MTAPDRSARAEAARRTILASGNPELINRLHLLDAAAPAAADGTPKAADNRHSPVPWGTAAAAGGGALGGVMLGTVLGGMMLDAQMRAAFAALAEDAGFDPETIQTTLAGLPAAAETPEPPGSDAPAENLGDSGDDDWLGGLFEL